MKYVYGKSVIRILYHQEQAPIPFKEYQNTSGCGTDDCIKRWDNSQRMFTEISHKLYYYLPKLFNSEFYDTTEKLNVNILYIDLSFFFFFVFLLNQSVTNILFGAILHQQYSCWWYPLLSQSNIFHCIFKLPQVSNNPLSFHLDKYNFIT